MNHISDDPETGRRTSDELTEVRTVLSRAESALERLGYIRDYGADQDVLHDEIRDDLEAVVSRLGRYRRTGRPRRAVRGRVTC